MTDLPSGLPRPRRVGTVLHGTWRIDDRIGSGGMASVYAATNIKDGRRAAIKMLHAPLSRDESTRSRFLREGYAANAISHPGVVRVFEDGVAEDGAAYLALELLEGETMEARRQEYGGALPIEMALDLADQMLDAIAAAHDKGIVHRDIKPDNVFLTKDGKAKLLDFGLARMKDTGAAEATATGVMLGTPEFMPPEQAIGRSAHVDARSDVWGLGATFFTVITGKYVHEADTVHQQLMASATQRARGIRSIAPHVSPGVGFVIDKALELDREDRWASAREMQKAFREARGPQKDFALDSRTLSVATSRIAEIEDDSDIEATQALDPRKSRRHPDVVSTTNELTVVDARRTGGETNPSPVQAHAVPRPPPPPSPPRRKEDHPQLNAWKQLAGPNPVPPLAPHREGMPSIPMGLPQEVAPRPNLRVLLFVGIGIAVALAILVGFVLLRGSSPR